MTMVGNNSAMQDERGILVDDSMAPHGQTPIQEAFQAIKNLILPTHKELITQLRVATPVKVSKIFVVPANGILGGGVAVPNLDQIVYTAPMSAEAWLHRITISSPEHGPGAPLQAGQLILIGSTFNEIIVTAPDSPAANVAPIQFIEGRYSAPHLDRGETLAINGDGLTAGNHFRIDLQITLVTGASEFTPKALSPSDLTKPDAPNAL